MADSKMSINPPGNFNFISPTNWTSWFKRFERYKLVKMVRSDDSGRQFDCEEFKLFAEAYGFQHVTSSPKYPKSNGQIASAVKIVKQILRMSSDPYLGPLVYRNTPLADINFSPAQLFMGRSLRDTLPNIPSNLIPKEVDRNTFKDQNDVSKAKQKENYDRRNRVKENFDLTPGEKVWITDLKRYGTVVAKSNTPRSYTVTSEGRNLRRNRENLKAIPEREYVDRQYFMGNALQPEQLNEQYNHLPPDSSVVTTWSGRHVKPPHRLDL